MELIIAREVICEWNALHALEQKQILLPLYGLSGGTPSASDLLVAFFCASSGATKDSGSCGLGAEIERHLQAGGPAQLYISEARVDFAGVNALQEQELAEIKKKYESRTTIDSYGDEKEFRAKFARHLEATIRTHPRFKIEAPASSAPACPSPATPPPARELTECARTLLSEACEDFEAYIGRVKVGATLKIQANGKQLVEQGNAESAATWDAAFNELLAGGYIRDAGCNGQLFQISSKGFDFLKSIGKTPVGYIAELGGM